MKTCNELGNMKQMVKDTSERDLAGINHLLNTKIPPERARAYRPEVHIPYPHLLRHRYRKTKHPVDDHTRHSPPSSLLTQCLR